MPREASDGDPSPIAAKLHRLIELRPVGCGDTGELAVPGSADRPITAPELAEAILALQPHLADTMFVQEVLTDLCSGRRNSAPTDILEALADFFGVDVKYFADGHLGDEAEVALLSDVLRRHGVRSLSLCRALPSRRETSRVLAFAVDIVRDRENE